MQTIYYINREKNTREIELVPAEGMLKWLYNKPLGRASLYLVVKRKMLSRASGWYMNSKLSKKKVDKFIDTHGLDMSVYHANSGDEFRHFNDFFTRTIKEDKRPVGKGVVSPADGKLLAFQTMDDARKFFIKGSEFSLDTFIGKSRIADKFRGGTLIIVRLAPADYHRFHFPLDGKVGSARRIKGRYYSVSPLALKQSLRIFCENHRVLTVLETEKYGEVLISEVGATMVGSIKQTFKPNTSVRKGDEKGYFAFGGSTVVLFFQKNRIKVDDDLIANTESGLETSVKMGETIAM